MKHPALFLSACLAVLTISLNAQRNFQAGYYITTQFDTVYGEIDNRGDLRNCHICTFRPGEGMEEISLEPGDIYAYRFSDGGKYYISKELQIDEEERSVFLEFLVNGISNLYYYRGEATNKYYLESAEGLFTELSNDWIEFEKDGVRYGRYTNLFVGQMKASFGDCPEIQSGLELAKFTHKSLISLTSRYHDYVCDDGLCIRYEKPIPVIRVSGGPYAGMITTTLDFPEFKGDFDADASYKWYHYYTFDRQTDFMFGLRFRFTMPRANEKLALLVLTEFTRSDYYSYVEDQTNPGLLTRMEANAHLSTLNLMTGLQYTYPKGRIRPSLTVGPVLSLDLNSYFDIEHVLVTDEREILQDYQTEPIKGMVLGGFTQLGMDWSVNGPHHLGLHLRYHFTRQGKDHYVNRDGASVSLYYNLTLN